jgi:glycyl-tRNA synthetase beta subunit
VKPARKTAARSAGKAAVDRKIELLFEVGCEEIPAGMLPRAEAEIRAGLEKQLTAENLIEGVTVESFSTPRRLVLCARG